MQRYGGHMTAEYSKLVPNITCPSCSKQMRLKMMEPVGERDRIIYDCACGFEYHESRAAATERRYTNA